MARRLAEYDERTAPLIDYYRGRSRFHRIDGYRPLDVVFADLLRIVGPGARGGDAGGEAGLSVQKSWAELQKMHRACTHRGGHAEAAGGSGGPRRHHEGAGHASPASRS